MATLNEWKKYNTTVFPQWYDILLRVDTRTYELNLFLDGDTNKWLWYWVSITEHSDDMEIPEAITGNVEDMQAYVLAAFKMR